MLNGLDQFITRPDSLTRGQVVCDDVVRDVSVQDHLEPGQGVVAQGAVDEGAVGRAERGDVHVVVKHDGSETRKVKVIGGK